MTIFVQVHSLSELPFTSDITQENSTYLCLSEPVAHWMLFQLLAQIDLSLSFTKEHVLFF